MAPKAEKPTKKDAKPSKGSAKKVVKPKNIYPMPPRHGHKPGRKVLEGFTVKNRGKMVKKYLSIMRKRKEEKGRKRAKSKRRYVATKILYSPQAPRKIWDKEDAEAKKKWGCRKFMLQYGLILTKKKLLAFFEGKHPKPTEFVQKHKQFFYRTFHDYRKKFRKHMYKCKPFPPILKYPRMNVLHLKRDSCYVNWLLKKVLHNRNELSRICFELHAYILAWGHNNFEADNDIYKEYRKVVKEKKLNKRLTKKQKQVKHKKKLAIKEAEKKRKTLVMRKIEDIRRKRLKQPKKEWPKLKDAKKKKAKEKDAEKKEKFTRQERFARFIARVKAKRKAKKQE